MTSAASPTLAWRRSSSSPLTRSRWRPRSPMRWAGNRRAHFMDSLHQPGSGQNANQDALKQALDRMWIQFLPLMMERVGILETTAAAVAANHLSTEQREAAHGAAHKLAGALGTF